MGSVKISPPTVKACTLKSLSLKINLMIVTTVTIVVACLGGYDYLRYTKNQISELRESLSTTTERLRASLSTPLWNLNAQEIESIVRGEMFNDNIQGIEVHDRYSQKAIITLGRNSDWQVQSLPIDSLTRHAFAAGEAEIKKSGKLLGHVRVHITDRFVHAESREQAVTFVWRMLALVLLVVVILMVIIQKYVVHPIALLETAFSAPVTSNPAKALDLTRKDEIGQLTRSFSLMRQHLASLFSERDRRIAELESTRKNLMASEERLRVLIDQSPIGLALCRMDGSFVTINPACAKIIGYSVTDALKLGYWDLTPKKYHQEEARQLELLKVHGRYGPYEKEYRHKDGHLVPVRLNGMILTREGENFIWSSVEDITALKKAEMEKSLLLEQLRQSQKMEAIGTLAGGIAHDFNNILSAVIGYAELTQRNPNCDAKCQENLEHVLVAAGRAKDLVKQILTFSRKASLSLEPIQLHLAVEEAVKLLRQTIPATITLNLEADSKTGTVLADATQIHQVVMNLCTNACHAIPEQRGEITITLKPVEIDDRTAAKHPNLRQGKYARLTVSDNGAGINQATMASIFDPFFTTKAQGEGTGMGLAVVHGIIQHHDGAIAVESVEGKGTTFKLFFPVAAVPAVAPTQSSAISTKQGNERILWVDDEAMLASLGKETLELLGYKVTATTSAQQALGLLRADPNGYDLLITDQAMPEMSGDLLVREALLVRADLPIIICTGHSATLNTEKALALGVKALLMKPLESGKLVDEIRRVLDNSA